MERIRELSGRLTALSPEELTELRGLIAQEFETLDGGERNGEVAKIATELGAIAQQLMGEETNRAAAQQQAEAEIEAARQQISALNPPAEGEGAEGAEGASAEGEGAEGAETDPLKKPAAADNPNAANATPAPVPVTASAGGNGSRVRRMAASQSRPQAGPEAGNERNQTALVASANLREVTPGQDLDRETLARAMAATLGRMQRPRGRKGGEGRDVLVASAAWAEQYPPERRLKNTDWEHNTRMLNNMQNTQGQSLTASGGICAPVNVDWSIGMLATADRPLRDGLPSFQATRGGLIFRPDLDFAAAASATSIWTEATDANPAGQTKAVYTVTCPGVNTVYVDAIPTRLQFGNMEARFDPETVAANTDAALAAAARVAEINILNKMQAAATQGVTAGKVLGAMRDLMTTIGQCAAAYRNLHRISPNQKLRGVFPEWVRMLLKIDLMREIGHAQTTEWNVFAISDAQIDACLAVWGIDPIWHLDGQPANEGGGTYVNQLFTTQNAGAVNAFPTVAVWYFYAEGQFQFLDGGRLDLGVVRDSLLDATNDYETFVEPFEGLAFRGFPGGCLQLKSTLCANGASAGTVDTSSSCV